MSSREKTPAQWKEINDKYEAASEKAVEDLARSIASQVKCPASRKPECRKDAANMIHSMLDHEGDFNFRNLPYTIKTKKSLRRFAKAVEDFEHVWNSTPLFPHLEVPITSIEELIAFGLRCKEVADTKYKRTKQEEAEKRRHAVRYAHDLMSKYDPNLTDIVSTKGKAFCKLSEALYVGLAEINDVERDDGISTVPDIQDVDLSSLCATHLRNVKS